MEHSLNDYLKHELAAKQLSFLLDLLIAMCKN